MPPAVLHSREGARVFSFLELQLRLALAAHGRVEGYVLRLESLLSLPHGTLDGLAGSNGNVPCRRSQQQASGGRMASCPQEEGRQCGGAGQQTARSTPAVLPEKREAASTACAGGGGGGAPFGLLVEQ